MQHASLDGYVFKLGHHKIDAQLFLISFQQP